MRAFDRGKHLRGVAFLCLALALVLLVVLGQATGIDGAGFQWTTALLGAGPLVVVAGVLYGISHLVDDVR